MPRTDTITVTDSDGKDFSVTIKKFSQGDRFAYQTAVAEALESASDRMTKFNEAQYKALTLGVTEWDFDEPITVKGLNELDPEVFDAILEALQEYNPVVWPSDRPTDAADEPS